MIIILQIPIIMQTVTHHLLIPMNPFLTILRHQMTKTLQRKTSFITHQILTLTESPPSNITSPFKQILKVPDNDQFSDRTRLPSQNQSTPPYTTDNRNTKTHYNLRQQPKMDYRLFIPPSKL